MDNISKMVLPGFTGNYTKPIFNYLGNKLILFRLQLVLVRFSRIINLNRIANFTLTVCL